MLDKSSFCGIILIIRKERAGDGRKENRMTEIFRRLRGTATPVAVYYKMTGGFCVGFVREADDEFVAMELISPGGRFDGYHCIRIEEILKLDVGTPYLENLVKVYRHYDETLPPLKVSAKGVLESFVDFAQRSKKLCTLEVGFDSLEKISGYVTDRDWNIVQIRLLDENGRPAGYTEVDVEAIVYIGMDSEFEKYLEILSSLNGGDAPDGKEGNGGKGRKEDRNILSFPSGK